MTFRGAAKRVRRKEFLTYNIKWNKAFIKKTAAELATAETQLKKWEAELAGLTGDFFKYNPKTCKAEMRAADGAVVDVIKTSNSDEKMRVVKIIGFGIATIPAACINRG